MRVSKLNCVTHSALSFGLSVESTKPALQLTFRATLAVPILLLIFATSQGAVDLSIQKRVNPNPFLGGYGGFPVSSFATDTGMNSGAPQNTWISYALGLTLTGGDKINAIYVKLGMPLSSNSGFSQRWNILEDPDTGDLVSFPTPISTNIFNGDSHLIV